MKKVLHILSYGIATIGLAFAAIFQIGVFDNYLLDNGVKLVNNELNYDSWQYWTYKHKIIISIVIILFSLGQYFIIKKKTDYTSDIDIDIDIDDDKDSDN